MNETFNFSTVFLGSGSESRTDMFTSGEIFKLLDIFLSSHTSEFSLDKCCLNLDTDKSGISVNEMRLIGN